MKSNSLRVLIACEFSGVVRDAFNALGHDAWSCDLIPSESSVSDAHFQCDVLHAIQYTGPDAWDLLIAHPPCTYLANSSNKHLYIGKKLENGPDEDRWNNMRQSAVFFNALRTCGIPRICLENPIQHGHARKLIPKYSQVVQPWMFGHPETKATCLWLYNLPKLKPTEMARRDYDKYPKTGGFEPRVHFESPGPDRWKNRSRTMPGLAHAMAEQFSAWCLRTA